MQEFVDAHSRTRLDGSRARSRSEKRKENGARDAEKAKKRWIPFADVSDKRLWSRLVISSLKSRDVSIRAS